MVSVQMLIIIIRLFQTCLEMSLEGQRTCLVLSERIEIDSDVRIDSEVVKFVSEEGITSVCIPVQVFLILSLCSCVQIEGVQEYIAISFKITFRREGVVVAELDRKSVV